MIQIIYLSVACQPFDAAALTSLLEYCRCHNAKNGITGALVYREGSFLQAIEGKAGPVEALMRRIRNDRRHTDVYEVERRLIEKRDFGDWAMSYSRLHPGQLPRDTPDWAQHAAMEQLFLQCLGLQKASDQNVAQAEPPTHAARILLSFAKTRDAIGP